jgi:cobalamin biosynthesis Mg chelatase CobN
MRTGGDDIAQALALIGARPTWEAGSGRVTGFEIVPLDLLARDIWREFTEPAETAVDPPSEEERAP